MNRSNTISGLLLLAVGTLFTYAGAPLADGELETVILFAGCAHTDQSAHPIQSWRRSVTNSYSRHERDRGNRSYTHG